MRRIAFCCVLAFVACTMSVAQKKAKLVEVEGKASYAFPEYVSRAAAREEVLRMAQEDALEGAFGRDIGSTGFTYIDNNGSQFAFTSLSQLRGVWVQTIGEPKFTRDIQDNQDVITCTVRGKARERSASQAWPEWQLQNAQGVETTQFSSGDYYRIAFRSAINGYLAIYLVDEEGQANRLLPYEQQEESVYMIRKGVSYRFFDSETGDVPCTEGGDNVGVVSDYWFTCNVPFVVNDLYVIFSPNHFAVPIDEQGRQNRREERLPPQLSQKKFLRWLAKVQAADEELCVDNRRAAIILKEAE